MNIVTRGLSQEQLTHAVARYDHPNDLLDACPQNFQLRSQCYGAVVFYELPGPTTTKINYTIREDIGLLKVNVETHKSDYEKQLLPLQWSVDAVCFHFLV